MKLNPKIRESRKEEPKPSFYEIPIKDIEGNPIDLHQFKNKKILIVNVASKCGFTNQYEGLQNLYESYSGNLEIIGSPCNQFANQEPKSDEEIQAFCSLSYGVSFTLTEKLKVKSPDQHPLYKWLTSKDLNGVKNSKVMWNFQKYLIDEQGKLLNYFYSTTKPQSKNIVKYLK